MTRPSPVNPALARAAVASFLEMPEWRQKIIEYGWRLESIDDLTLYAVLRARPLNDRIEDYTVRLSCDYYPTHPPDAKFVNPQTLEYKLNKDLNHLPKLAAPYCQVHPVYNWDHPYRYGPQLVCSSMTLGYYFSNHSPTADQVWEPGRHTIGSTIHTIHRALHSTHYSGRYVQ
ncbi:MAG TPA: hypothetical protein VGN10_13140 [Pyrinomonadaceae bacterium]|jgi:hypothetical protein